LKVDADDLVSFSEQVDIRAEHLEGTESAVEKDERLSLPEYLVAELDSVDAR
jgi:hypothetical protein